MGFIGQPMDHDHTTGVHAAVPGFPPVFSIRIGNVQRPVVAALQIAPVNNVFPFGRALVPRLDFVPHRAAAQ